MVDPVAFLGVSLLVIVTPGQDTALTIRNTVLGGRRGGLATAGGVVAGQLCWALATSLGLVAVLLAWQPAFVALKLAGGAYLMFLGVQALWSAVGSTRPSTRTSPRLSARRPDTRAAGQAHADGPRLGAAAAFRQGVLSNLANPKMAVFFPSLLPQFVPVTGASVPDLLLPGVVFACLTLGWLSCYAAAVARAGDVLRRPPIRRVLDAITGTVLVALGLRVVTEAR